MRAFGLTCGTLMNTWRPAKVRGDAWKIITLPPAFASVYLKTDGVLIVQKEGRLVFYASPAVTYLAASNTRLSFMGWFALEAESHTV